MHYWTLIELISIFKFAHAQIGNARPTMISRPTRFMNCQWYFYVRCINWYHDTPVCIKNIPFIISVNSFTCKNLGNICVTWQIWKKEWSFQWFKSDAKKILLWHNKTIKYYNIVLNIAILLPEVISLTGNSAND